MAEYERELEARIEHLEGCVAQIFQSNKELCKLLYACLQSIYGFRDQGPWSSVEDIAANVFEDLDLTDNYSRKEEDFIKAFIGIVHEKGYLDCTKDAYDHV